MTLCKRRLQLGGIVRNGGSILGWQYAFLPTTAPAADEASETPTASPASPPPQPIPRPRPPPPQAEPRAKPIRIVTFGAESANRFFSHSSTALLCQKPLSVRRGRHHNVAAEVDWAPPLTTATWWIRCGAISGRRAKHTLTATLY